MIRSFRHKGLKKLFDNDDASGIPSELTDKLKNILARLEAANHINGMSMPRYKLHPLKGDYKGFWSVTANGKNLRVIFRFDNVKGDASDVDLIDYH